MLYEFSKNRKLNTILNHIADSLNDMGIEEIIRYTNAFPHETDFNIAQYGNVLVYYDDVRALYESSGYKSIKHWNDNKLWETYRRQVGYVARYLVRQYSAYLTKVRGF